MIDNYNDAMNSWANPTVGTCSGTMEIIPDMDFKRWCVQQTVTVLANADYYYTREEVDKLLEGVTHDGVTKEEVEAMIKAAIASKAEKAELETLKEKVSENTEKILGVQNSLLKDYYTKIQTNSMFGNYSRVDGVVLELNADNII